MNDTPPPTDEPQSESQTEKEDRTLVRQMVEEIRRLTETAGGPLPAWIGAIERIVSVEAVPSLAPEKPAVRAEETPLPPDPAPCPVEPLPPMSTATAFPVIDAFAGFLAATEIPSLPNAEELAREHFHKGERYRHERDYDSALAAYTQALWFAPRSVPILLERGRVFLMTGKADFAVADFDAVLTQDPNHAEAFLWRGNAFTEQGLWDEAIADFTAAIDRAPADTAALLNRGLVYAKLQDYTRVLADAHEALRIAPSLPGAHFLRSLALSHAQPHDPTVAEVDHGTPRSNAEHLQGTAPSDPLSNSCGCDLTVWAALFRPSPPPRPAAEPAAAEPSTFGQARQPVRPNLQKRKTQLAPVEEAEACEITTGASAAPPETLLSQHKPVISPPIETTDDEVVDLGASQPDSAETFVHRRSPPTMLNIELGDAAPRPESAPAAEAAPPAAKSLPVNATDIAKKYFQKGESYRSRGDLRRALGCYTEALRLDPHWVPALMERGQIYRQGRKPDRAIADFNAALELDATHVEIYLRRGNALLDQGRIDEAIDDFNTAIQLDPDHAEAFTIRARAHFRNRDNGKTIEDASEAIRLDPELASAYLLRGTAYSNRNHHDEAIADLDQAVRREPRNALAYNERGLAHARKADYVQAIANYNKALGLTPKLAVARFNRGLANRFAGNYPMAVVDFSEFLAQQPQTAEAYFQRALAYRGQGDFLYAIADLDKALALKPDHAEAQQCRAETELEAIQDGALVSADAETPDATADASANPEPVLPPIPVVPRSTPQSPASSAPSARTPANPPQAPAQTAPSAAQKALANPCLRKRSSTSKTSPQAPPATPTGSRYRRVAWMSGAALGALLLVFAGTALVGSMSIASAVADDSRFTTEQLCESGAAERVKGKELEVSGVAESVNQGDGSPPAITLIGAKGTGKVVCTINPTATSTRTMFPNVEKGKYVVVKGRCEGTDGEGVKLVDARVAFVMNPAKKRTKK
jgi:tetratricopeptide (TPR) repeat protein